MRDVTLLGKFVFCSNKLKIKKFKKNQSVILDIVLTLVLFSVIMPPVVLNIKEMFEQCSA